MIVRLRIAGQSRVGQRMLEATVGPSITGLATAVGLSGVLGIELGHEFLCKRFQGGDPFAAPRRLLCRTLWIVCDHQALFGKLAFRDGRLGRIESQPSRGAAQLAESPRRHRQDELKLACRGDGERLQLRHVVQAQQAAIDDHNHPLDSEAT